MASSRQELHNRGDNMRLNQVSTNHAELTGVHQGHSWEICFSYGRPCVLRFGGEYYINRNVWKLSPTTSKHINVSFPELKGVNIDSVGFPPYHFVVDDDYQIEKALTLLLGGVK
jgi:hypothetical protein